MVWCSQMNEKKSLWKRNFLQYQRGLVDATLRSLMLCPFCRSPMVEDQSSRFLQPMVCVRLISLKAFKAQNCTNSLLHQTVDVFIRTEKLWKQIHLGDAFTVQISKWTQMLKNFNFFGLQAKNLARIFLGVGLKPQFPKNQIIIRLVYGTDFIMITDPQYYLFYTKWSSTLCREVLIFEFLQ